MTFIEKSAIILVTTVSILACGGCTNSQKTIRTLEDQGYTNVETTGYAFFGCPEDDTFHTAFKATSPNGHKVSGVACSGWIFGSVIRFD
ncbi:MAG TPA: hypothetical protein VFM18_11625 [Methanosarcina sp.]|nr:hypothetical protein [Methanosarcina sp.]